MENNSATNEQPRKPYIGGYRNNITGQIYHNAVTQTQIFKPKAKVKLPKLERQTQTVALVTRSQQTNCDKFTQSEYSGIHMTRSKDYLIAPLPYQTADERITQITRQIIVIQKYWRGYKARKIFYRMRDEQRRVTAKELLKQQKMQGVPSRTNFHKQLKEANLYSKQDFEDFYNQLEVWKQKELTEIAATTMGSSRKAALCQLVLQEAQFLALLDQQKQFVKTEKRDKAIYELLSQMAQPKVWETSDGKIMRVETLVVHRLRKLKSLYYELQTPNGGKSFQEDRLNKLVELKQILQDGDTSVLKLKNEILQLVDREVELMARRASYRSFGNLRRRLKFLLLQYILLYYMNSNNKNGCADTVKARTSRSAPCHTRSKVAKCQGCSQYQPLHNFQSSAAASLSLKCRSCRDLDNTARSRREFRVYRYLLANLRRDEETMDNPSGFAHILQETDIQHLVDKIWLRRSALSGIDDLIELTLCRWNPEEKWTPGNCILLTEDEARIHQNMSTTRTIEENYGLTFIQKVKHKQSMARQYFSRLSHMDDSNQRTIKSIIVNVKPALSQNKMTVSIKL